jgi:hypothetical protein
MHKLLCGLLAAGLIVPACPGADAWHYVHPQAKMLAGIEWRRLAQSPAGAELRKQMDLAGKTAMGGLDLFDSVDRVLISSPGGASTPGNPETPVVVVVSGRFNLPQLRQVLSKQGLTARRYGIVEVLCSKGKPGFPPLHLALLDAQTLVLGAEADLRTLFTSDGRPAALAVFCQRGRELSVRNDLWMVATVPAGQLAEPANPQAKMLSEVKQVEAGASFRSGFELLVNLTTSSEDSARSLATGIQIFATMALTQQAGQPQIAELGRKLRIAPAGPVVQIALSLDAAELERGLASLRQASAAHMPQIAVRPVYRGNTLVPAPSAQPEKPPEKQVIRIYGLDEGTKEIPITKP